MKFGLRTPSLKKRISARTSWKRAVRHRGGLKMPRGAGIVSNPKKAMYNKVYNKTSFGITTLSKKSTVKNKRNEKKELNYVEQKIEDKAYVRNLSTRGKHICKKCNSDNWAVMSCRAIIRIHEALYCEKCHKIGQTYKRDKGESIEDFLQFLKKTNNESS